MLDVLEDAIKAATWLTPADAASVEIAKILARELQNAVDVRDIVSLSKQFSDVLQTLGMNIAGRTGKAEAEREVSPLDAIKARSQIRLADSKTVKSKPAASKSRTRSAGTRGGSRDASPSLAGVRTSGGTQNKPRQVGKA
jgi:hypothetical protein